MLDFYGMKVVSEQLSIFKIERNEKYEERYKNLLQYKI